MTEQLMASDTSSRNSQVAGISGRNWALIAIVTQLFILGIWFGITGQFQAIETNDSPGYIHVNWGSMVDVFGNLRTPGYPAFLAALRAVSSDTRIVPAMHFVLYALSVLLFFSGLFLLTQDIVRAFIGASALVYTRVLFGYVSIIATDTLAAAFGVMVCGLIMIRLCSPGIVMSLLLSLAVMAGWLIRPAYLFLVPLVPVMSWMVYPALKQPLQSRRWHAATALLLAIAPLLLYSTLRLSVVGRFGIVSFGGFNVLGVAGQFLVNSDVPLLSDDLRGIASAAIERRDSGRLRVGDFDDLPLTNYMRMEDRYDLTIWYVFSDSESSEVVQNPVKLNSQLRRLAQELIWLHPREYLTWLVKASRQAARKLMWDFADNGFTFILLLIAAIVLILHGYQWNREAYENSDPLKVLAMFAVIYCVMSLAVVIPVCPPLGRFTDSAAVLLASPFAVWIWDAFQRWRP